MRYIGRPRKENLVWILIGFVIIPVLVLHLIDFLTLGVIKGKQAADDIGNWLGKYID